MKEFWDSRPDASSGDITIAHQVILRHCGEVRGLAVLELGCGSASLSRACAGAGAAYTVAVDFSEPTIARAMRLTNGRLVTFQCADALSLRLPQRFDLIIGTFFLHEVKFDSFERLLDVLDYHLAPGGRIIFFENSFFNPVFRFIRRHLVDRGYLRKVGAQDETPFDNERFQLMARRFPRTTRQVDHFVLFSRALGQFFGHRQGLRWTGSFGNFLDSFGRRLPPTSGIAKSWSYLQTIRAER